ncbi:MAG: tripartite tricarboxylate transporter substrate-binding protein [Beijerinckiaceae bacterium]|nr:tripartite tricarboxylate transporter substrate-binding protein [Beijerinckiaceae bacterium]
MAKSVTAACGAAALWVLSGWAPASAQQGPVWSKLVVNVGFSAFGGVGGYDTYARLLARHIGKYVPGKPTVIVANKPGAGGLTVMNYMFNAAPKDGSEIAMVGRGNAMQPMLFGPQSNSKFEADRFAWIGSMNKEISVFAVMQHASLDLQAVQKGAPAAVGVPGAGSDPYVFGLLMNRMLGTNLKIIAGYPGMNEVQLAMDNGELAGVTGVSWDSFRVDKADWIKSGRANVILQFAGERSPDLPHVPTLSELVKDERDRVVIDLVMARQTMGRPLLAPPDVSADRVTALRDAYSSAMKDKELIQEADKMGMAIRSIDGASIQKIIDAMMQASPEIVERARAVLAER